MKLIQYMLQRSLIFIYQFLFGIFLEGITEIVFLLLYASNIRRDLICSR